MPNLAGVLEPSLPNNFENVGWSSTTSLQEQLHDIEQIQANQAQGVLEWTVRPDPPSIYTS